MNICCFNERLSSAASIVLSLWFSLSGLAAFIGNAIVLWIFYKNASLRTISNRFLASLCVADLFVGLVIDPTWIAIRCLIQPPESHILFNAMDMMWIHSTAATVFNLCCVSVDRFIAIRFPFRYQDIITKKTCDSVIILVWLISLLLPFSFLILKHNSAKNFDKLWLSLSAITFVLPLTLVTLCYFWIFKVARKQARMITRRNLQASEDKSTPVRAAQNYKAVKTIGYVLGVFILSWLPSLVVSCVHYFTGNDKCFYHKLLFVVWPWIEAIAFTSSAINPWIYCFRNGEFRESMHLNFLCSWPCLHARVTPERNSDRNQRQGNAEVLASKAFNETKL
ncbi:beta-2 adrenergic receptor-like [Oculina patagonica]